MTWLQELRKRIEATRTAEAPVFWDGFCNVLLRGESSHADDNPYWPEATELRQHVEYRAGARAAEALLRYTGEAP